MTIRRAVSADTPAIAAILVEAFEPVRLLFTGGAYRATCKTPAELEDRLAQGPTWVAEDEGVLIGTVSALERFGGVFVRSMAVVPAGQGKGAALALLQCVEAFARERGASRMFLETAPFMHRAIALYERYGFARTTGEREDLYGTPLINFEKHLHKASPLRD